MANSCGRENLPHTTLRTPFPLAMFSSDNEPLDARQAARWLWTLLALGILARVLRYALRFPFWYDEAALSASFLDRGYLDLLRPLECGQAAPILFLWVQLAFVRLLGFSELSLRLFPLLTGLASLFVFYRLTGRLLQGTARVLAFGVLAVSYPAIRYAAEAKPYGTDLFVSLVLVTLAVEWLARPERLRWLWALAAAAPLAVGLSFPAVFVGGGVSLAVAWELGRRGPRRGWVAWVMMNALLAGSFLLVQAAAKANLLKASNQGMQVYWQHAFPPSGSPLEVLEWLAATHTGQLLAHPFGGDRGASTLTFLLCAAAVAALLRRRQGAVLLVCLVPPLLNLLAAALHRYPYGGHVRLAMHLAPIVGLLAGTGAAAVLNRAGKRWPAIVVLGLLGLLAAGTMVRDLACPMRSENDTMARDFARWFWTAKSYDAELVCAKTDFRLPFTFPIALEGNEAMYLCNQRIYSPRHARGEPPHTDRVAADRPLRCAWFRVVRLPCDEVALQGWLDGMQSRYRLASRQSYPIPVFNKDGIEEENRVELFEFVPR